MNNVYTRSMAFLCLFLMQLIPMQAQNIWPGDLNNNGKVTGIDLLYWGYSNNMQGPARDVVSTLWQANAMGTAWLDTLPNGQNAAYVDANGDGIVDDTDLNDAIAENYGKTHDTLEEDVFPASTNTGDYFPLLMTSSVQATEPGATLEVNVDLGTEENPLKAFYGITFKVNYPSDVIITQASFQRATDWWIDPDGGKTRILTVNDTTSNTLEVNITRIDHKRIEGLGRLGVLQFQLSDFTTVNLPYNLNLEFSDVMCVDNFMNIQDMNYQGVDVIVTGSLSGGGCFNTIAPVCGSNGVTYLNSCYAEAAGVTVYSEGTCFGGCIDPTQINPTAICPTYYQPVCGCNGETYANACEAEAAGVTEYSTGVCNTTCFDPYYVVAASGTTVDYNSGVVSMTCTTGYDPVCACNGITYPNACTAEAAGMTYYTSGTCGAGCIDYEDMDPYANCTTVYDPVCGCNGETYTNSCVAEASGVQSYTYGVCGSTSNWCSSATSITCGDFLAYETTVGATNQITSYPGCSNNTFMAPEKVYVINKTSAGDLQIGLEILTPGLDLDIFLLSDNCNNIQCLGSSTSSNSVTNNEGILLEDAPLGLYYIVVDGQYAGSQGSYNLEVSCGYLYCGDAQALWCGEAFNYSNYDGDDNVSLYGCDGNLMNVENNGPEVVHYFTTTTAGQVTIDMTGLSDNLELFLLRSCDRGDCMDFSQNPGTSDEHISAWLNPGTYYVVVDGYNGATSNYSLYVDCDNPCDLDMILSATSTGCGSNSGSINVSSTGGTPGFIIHYSGPVSGSFYTASNNCNINNLPAGTYTITKTDSNGCQDTETITIQSSGGLLVWVDTNDASCMNQGSVDVSVSGGAPTYSISLSGPVNAQLSAASSQFTINNLPAGAYTMYISDASACSSVQTFTIGQSSGNFSFTATPNPGSCGALGSISIATNNGVAPYTVHVSGPICGSTTVYYNDFNIINLPAGTYTITIEDDNWCTYAVVVNLPNGNIDLTATALNNSCGSNGSIHAVATGGSAPYTFTWSGPSSGSITTNSNEYTIPNLPNGSYSIQVEDGNWCSDYTVVTVSNTGGGLGISVMELPGNCGELGSIWIDIHNGQAPYTVSWTGPSSGYQSGYNNGYDIPNLQPGYYTVTVTDVNGCSATTQVQLSGGSNLDVSLTPANGSCGQYGSIQLDIIGGSPNYTVSWSGSASGSTIISSNAYTIPNLQSGTYSISVTDGSGCTDYAVTTINNTSGGNITLNAVPVSGDCNQNGSIWLDIIGGSATYTISWAGPSNGSMTSQVNGVSIADLPAGTYWVYVTDANGCTGTTQVTVTTNNTDLQFSLTAQAAICGGLGSIYGFMNSGTAPYSISWTGASTGSMNSNSSTFTIPNLPAGTYVVWVTDANGCGSDNTVTIQQLNDLNVTLSPEAVDCGSPAAIWVDVHSGTAPYVVQWSGPQNGTTTVYTNGFNIPNLPDGTYTVLVTDANGCTDQGQVYIQTYSNIQITAVPDPGVCGAPGSIHIGVSNGTAPFSIVWSGAQNGNATTSNQFYNIENLPGGIYTITVTDANGCTDTSTVNLYHSGSDIQVNPTLVLNDCGQYNWIWLDIIGGTPIYTITWTGPENGSGTSTDGAFEIMDLPPGQYEITVTDVNGCVEVIWVTVYDGPLNLIDLIPTPGLCGEDGSITVNILSGTPNYTLTWTGSSSGSAIVAGGSYTLADLPSGNYTFTVFDSMGCAETETVYLNNQNSDLDVIPTLIHNDCGQMNWIWLDIIGGTPIYTITWTGPQNGSGTSDNGAFELMDLPPGQYEITVTDANGCVVVIWQTIDHADINLMNVTPMPNDCEAYGDIQIDIFTGNPGYTVTWTGPQSGSIDASSTGTYFIENLPSGTYVIHIVDSFGCEETEVVTLVNNESDLSVVPNLIHGPCGQYNWIWLDILGGDPIYTITWTGPENGSGTSTDGAFEIMDLPPGQYEIKVTDANGCMEIIWQTIYPTTIDLMDVQVSGGVCDTYSAIHVTTTGGTADYTLTWSGPSYGSHVFSGGTYSITSLPAGVYTLTLVDAMGCIETETVNVSGAGGVNLVTTPINVVCNQLGGIQVYLNGGLAPYTVSWSGAQSGQNFVSGNSYTIPNLPEGSYTVNVVDQNGCTDSEIVTIVSSQDDLSVNVQVTNGDCEELGSLAVQILGGTPTYTIVWTGPTSGSAIAQSGIYTIPNLLTGTYTIDVQDQNGCVETVQSDIYNNNNLNVSSMATPGPCGTAGSIWMDFYDGVAPYTIAWSGPMSGIDNTNANWYDIVNLVPGQYTVTVTDANGCVYMETIVIPYILDDMNVSATVNPGGCGFPASIDLAIDGGTGPFEVEWYGTNSSGQYATASRSYTIFNLPSGIYQISVTDANGCDNNLSIQVLNNDNNLVVGFTPIHPTCTQSGAIGVLVNGGVPDYVVNWTGPTSGSVTVAQPNYIISGLQGGTYQITVFDNSGCSAYSNIYLDDTPETPVVDFGYEISGLTVDFTNLSADGNYTWNFGDGSNTTEESPSHTFAGSGTYSVCLTVNNSCGNNTICYQITVWDASQRATIEVANAIVNAQEESQVPVFLHNCENLVSLSGSLQFTGNATGEILDLVPATINPQYNAVNKTFNFYDNNGTGINLTGDEVLFYVRVSVSGNPGEMAMLKVVDSPLLIELGGMLNDIPTVLPHSEIPGMISISNAGNITGEVTTYGGEGISAVSVYVEGTGVDMMAETNTEGRFSVPDLQYGNQYSLYAEKDDDDMNGLSTYALFIGQRFILGMEPSQIYSPYQVIAGDANCNEAFTTLDLFLIQQLIIGERTEFASCPSWVFVSQYNNQMPVNFTAYNVFPYNSTTDIMMGQTQNINFVGVKVGDILGAATVDNTQTPSGPRSGDLELNITDRAVNSGEMIDIPVTSANFHNIASYQFGLDYDESMLRFEQFIPSGDGGLGSVAAAEHEGAMRISWFDVSGLGYDVDSDEPLFTLRFEVLASAASLYDLFSIDTHVLSAQAHQPDGLEMGINLMVGGVTVDTEELMGNSFQLYQNEPNPFVGSTAVPFQLPEAMEVQLIIRDNLGRVVNTQEGRFNKGMHNIAIDRDQLDAGLYYYTLRAGEFTATKKMILLE